MPVTPGSGPPGRCPPDVAVSQGGGCTSTAWRAVWLVCLTWAFRIRTSDPEGRNPGQFLALGAERLSRCLQLYQHVYILLQSQHEFTVWTNSSGEKAFWKPSGEKTLETQW